MSDQNGQQSWRDRLFGGSNDAEQPTADPTEGPEIVEEDTLAEAPVADEVTDEDLAQAEAEQAAPAEARHENSGDAERRAWEAEFDGEEKDPSAEYRPSPSTPAPDAEVEPRVVPPSTLRGPNPTGEMNTVEPEAQPEPEASPELVEPARPQLSLRRRERAIADAREAEAALADEPASDVPEATTAAAPVADEPAEAEVPREEDPAPTQALPAQEPMQHVDEPERPVDEQQTRVLDEQEHRPAEDDRATNAIPAAGAAAAGTAAVGATATSGTDSSERDVDDIMFVEQPDEPRKRGARGVGFVVVLLSTIVFGGLFGLALVAADYLFNTEFDAGQLLSVWLTPEWIFPVVAFFLSYWLLTLIVNRAGWWAHVLGGFIVALITYGAFIFASNFTHNGGWADLGNFFAFTRDGVVPAILSAGAVFAFILAREVPIWLGGIVSKRGRKQRERYNAELEEYRRQTARAED